MSIVRIKDERVVERHVKIKGEAQIFREQRACILLGGGYETTFNIGLGDGPVHSVGDYLFDGDSYALGQYGDIGLNRRPKLKPLVAWLKECGLTLPATPAAAK